MVVKGTYHTILLHSSFPSSSLHVFDIYSTSRMHIESNPSNPNAFHPYSTPPFPLFFYGKAVFSRDANAGNAIAIKHTQKKTEG